MMERKLHRIDQVLRDRAEAASKIKHARGPRRKFWQDRVAECDRLLALDRMMQVDNRRKGSPPVEYEVAIERIEGAAPSKKRVDRYEGMPFSPGCVVTLVSGGHKMTVLDCRQVCSGDLEVDLIWSSYGDHFGKATVPASCVISDSGHIPF